VCFFWLNIEHRKRRKDENIVLSCYLLKKVGLSLEDFWWGFLGLPVKDFWWGFLGIFGVSFCLGIFGGWEFLGVGDFWYTNRVT
jgi:hypothetical protein